MRISDWTWTPWKERRIEVAFGKICLFLLRNNGTGSSQVSESLRITRKTFAISLVAIFQSSGSWWKTIHLLSIKNGYMASPLSLSCSCCIFSRWMSVLESEASVWTQSLTNRIFEHLLLQFHFNSLKRRFSPGLNHGRSSYWR
jgi:hypothetical protein